MTRLKPTKLKEALLQCLYWHESQDKALSKQPNANFGESGWMRLQHREQIDLINAALEGKNEQGN